MTGARKFAFDQILPAIPAGCLVLDVGCGDSPLAGLLAERGCRVTAIDRDAERLGNLGSDWRVVPLSWDLTVTPWPLPDGAFDRIVAVYSLQHLLGDEARAWLEIRRLLKPDGAAMVVGRCAAPSRVENDRLDPLNGYSQEGLCGLAMATGLRLARFHAAQYDDESWRMRPEEESNVFWAILTVPQ